MTYFDIVNKAIDLVVVTDDKTNMSYLEPCWRILLAESGIELDGDEDQEEIGEILKLEVEKRNAKADVTRPVVQWLYNVINEIIDPAMTKEENELMKNLMAYMEMNDKLNDKEKELAQKEQALEVKDAIGGKMPLGMNFAKKKP